MRIALICFHKGAATRYPEAWLRAYAESIEAQSERADLYEVDYGGGEQRLLSGADWSSLDLPTHAHAQNWLLGLLFEHGGYDAVLNTNVDDVYAPNYVRVSRELLEGGADVSNGDFVLIDADGRVTHPPFQFHTRNFAQELESGHNVVCHPAVGYSRRLWEDGFRYDPSEIPFEDLRAWQRIVGTHCVCISHEVVVHHRVYDGSVSAR